MTDFRLTIDAPAGGGGSGAPHPAHCGCDGCWAKKLEDCVDIEKAALEKIVDLENEKQRLEEKLQLLEKVITDLSTQTSNMTVLLVKACNTIAYYNSHHNLLFEIPALLGQDVMMLKKDD